MVSRNVKQPAATAALLLSLVLLATGCGHFTTAHGLRRSEAEKITDYLEVGMPEDSVRALLGEPSFVSETDYGSGTSAGDWRGREWLYSFNRFMAKPTHLYLIFRQVETGWQLYHWQWGDFR